MSDVNDDKAKKLDVLHEFMNAASSANIFLTNFTNIKNIIEEDKDAGINLKDLYKINLEDMNNAVEIIARLHAFFTSQAIEKSYDLSKEVEANP